MCGKLTGFENFSAQGITKYPHKAVNKGLMPKTYNFTRYCSGREKASKMRSRTFPEISFHTGWPNHESFLHPTIERNRLRKHCESRLSSSVYGFLLSWNPLRS